MAHLDMPCMALVLDGRIEGERAQVQTPPLDVVGALNDRAYGQPDRLAPLITALDDPRITAYGVRDGAAWACVLLTLRIGDDISIQYVATEAEHRRRGHASALMRAALAEAHADGATTATLQASPDGRPVYERLGFTTVATLRATVA
jgi:ribosomal protein S18 acetylase RimI-like enzyme